MSRVDSPECVKFLVVTENSLDTVSSVVHVIQRTERSEHGSSGRSQEVKNNEKFENCHP